MIIDVVLIIAVSVLVFTVAFLVGGLTYVWAKDGVTPYEIFTDPEGAGFRAAERRKAESR